MEILRKEGTDSGIKNGFLDFDFDSKVIGNKRSCIQDCFAIVGNIYGKDSKDEIYKDCPPRTYKDTILFSVLQSKVAETHFRFHNVTDEFKMNEKSLEFVLLNQVNNGVYIATSQVHCIQKDKTYENHAFMYNSHFTQEKYPLIQGVF